MEIILHGSLNNEETAKSLNGVLQYFKERYHILSFREIHMHVTLVDGNGDEVELVDTKTNQVYRVFEVRQENQLLDTKRPLSSGIHLVVDNTHPVQDKK
jgi:hypothetical protein